jgi:dethiobiotin synthetase
MIWKSKSMTASNLNRSLFITGTDTGVGKTLVTAALARYLSSQHVSVGVMKPVETGVSDPSSLGEDAKLLRWAAGSNQTANTISPYRFSMPVAPAQAAAATQTNIDVEQIQDTLNELQKTFDIVLVEGAGGLMVPIQGGFLIADLVRTLQAPLLLVTHPRLGTINHTLLTTFCAQALEIDLVGYLINRMPSQASQAEREAPHWLASLASSHLLGVLPEVSGDSQNKVLKLVQAIETLPTLQWLRSAICAATQLDLSQRKS